MEVDAASRPEWIEASGPDGENLARTTSGASDPPAAIEFTLPLAFTGRIVSRVRYASGGTWRRETALP